MRPENQVHEVPSPCVLILSHGRVRTNFPKRHAKNVTHPTLPEIKVWGALGDGSGISSKATGNNLRAHPQISACLEPFHNREEGRVRVDGHAWKTNESAFDVRSERVFQPKEGARAAGCKRFVFHRRQNLAASDIWRRAQRDRDIRMIFPTRENLVNRILSGLRAGQSGVWYPETEDDMTSQHAGQIEVFVRPKMLVNRMKDLCCGESPVRDAVEGAFICGDHF